MNWSLRRNLKSLWNCAFAVSGYIQRSPKPFEDNTYCILCTHKRFSTMARRQALFIRMLPVPVHRRIQYFLASVQVLKNREAPEFAIHTHVAGKLSDIQFLFHISSMYLLYAVLNEIIGLNIKIHKNIGCILTTTRNFIFVREAMKTNNIFSITGIGALPHAPCICIRHITAHCVWEGKRDQLLVL